MTTIKVLVAKHPVVTYVVLTFAISWGGVQLVIGGRSGMSGIKAQDNPLFPFAVLATAITLRLSLVSMEFLPGLALFMILDGLGGLPAFRVLMVWVYDRTRSVFVGILMHVSLTACTRVLTPQIRECAWATAGAWPEVRS